MKLIVGLGNPGKEYLRTRHNLGFIILDNYLKDISWKEKYQALIYKTKVNNKDVLFVKPQTYMNLSGNAVRKLVQFYDITLDDILVIRDDLDLPIGKLKIKYNSSSGGHNGIKNIIDNLNSQNFYQLKIGIDFKDDIDIREYVTNKLTKKEIKKINDNMSDYLKVIDLFINDEIEQAMNKYN